MGNVCILGRHIISPNDGTTGDLVLDGFKLAKKVWSVVDVRRSLDEVIKKERNVLCRRSVATHDWTPWGCRRKEFSEDFTCMHIL